ncbi:MAG: 3-dehydroquinate dehydratase [Verrucomicrobiota bacterium]
MPPQKRVKAARSNFRTVGVITTTAGLRLASRMSRPPDLFELRLDCLFPAEKLEKKIGALPAPVIITARHPAEGGENNLPPPARRDLLMRFLPAARYVDIELRSVRGLETLLDRIRRRNVRLIISVHDLGSIAPLGSLRAKASRAKALGAAVFKVATRTDTPAQLGRLLEFVYAAQNEIVISAMGTGKLGAVSRILLAQSGSALSYVSVGAPRIKGQMSLEDFRGVLRQIEPA